MSYRDLEIWDEARHLAAEVHRMTLHLPRHELYETGSQIRRSANSVRSNIVEGYGRRRYKQEFIRFLVYAHASCDETIDHLEALQDCGSLCDKAIYTRLHDGLLVLSRKINLFIQAVEREHRSEK
jgi:four helix bundle protein